MHPAHAYFLVPGLSLLYNLAPPKEEEEASKKKKTQVHFVLPKYSLTGG